MWKKVAARRRCRAPDELWAADRHVADQDGAILIRKTHFLVEGCPTLEYFRRQGFPPSCGGPVAKRRDFPVSLTPRSAGVRSSLPALPPRRQQCTPLLLPRGACAGRAHLVRGGARAAHGAAHAPASDGPWLYSRRATGSGPRPDLLTPADFDTRHVLYLPLARPRRRHGVLLRASSRARR